MAQLIARIAQIGVKQGGKAVAKKVGKTVAKKAAKAVVKKAVKKGAKKAAKKAAKKLAKKAAKKAGKKGTKKLKSKIKDKAKKKLKEGLKESFNESDEDAADEDSEEFSESPRVDSNTQSDEKTDSSGTNNRKNRRDRKNKRKNKKSEKSTVKNKEDKRKMRIDRNKISEIVEEPDGENRKLTKTHSKTMKERKKNKNVKKEVNTAGRTKRNREAKRDSDESELPTDVDISEISNDDELQEGNSGEITKEVKFKKYKNEKTAKENRRKYKKREKDSLIDLVKSKSSEDYSSAQNVMESEEARRKSKKKLSKTEKGEIDLNEHSKKSKTKSKKKSHNYDLETSENNEDEPEYEEGVEFKTNKKLKKKSSDFLNDLDEVEISAYRSSLASRNVDDTRNLKQDEIDLAAGSRRPSLLKRLFGQKSKYLENKEVGQSGEYAGQIKTPVDEYYSDNKRTRKFLNSNIGENNTMLKTDAYDELMDVPVGREILQNNISSHKGVHSSSANAKYAPGNGKISPIDTVIDQTDLVNIDNEFNMMLFKIVKNLIMEEYGSVDKRKQNSLETNENWLKAFEMVINHDSAKDERAVELEKEKLRFGVCGSRRKSRHRRRVKKGGISEYLTGYSYNDFENRGGLLNPLVSPSCSSDNSTEHRDICGECDRLGDMISILRGCKVRGERERKKIAAHNISYLDQQVCPCQMNAYSYPADYLPDMQFSANVSNFDYMPMHAPYLASAEYFPYYDNTWTYYPPY